MQAQEVPYIDDVQPDQARCGQELDLTIVGGGFVPDAAVEIPVDGVEVRYTEFIGREELRAGIVVYDHASVGTWSLSVWAQTGGATLDDAFTIQCDIPDSGSRVFIPDKQDAGREFEDKDNSSAALQR